MTEQEYVDQLADRFTAMCVSKWIDRGLPLRAIAAAFVAWGLSESVVDASPSEVAEGLQRMADEIQTAAIRAPRHLI